jgi:hypothetical protein
VSLSVRMGVNAQRKRVSLRDRVPRLWPIVTYTISIARATAVMRYALPLPVRPIAAYTIAKRTQQAGPGLTAAAQLY